MPRMALVNNVDLEALRRAREEAKENPRALLKRLSISGEWRVQAQEPPQFLASLTYEKGSSTIEAESPAFLGGRGTHPGPLQLCLAGLASCFLSTFVGTCSEMGIRLRRARVHVSCEIDFRPVLGLEDAPINRGVEFVVEAEAEDGRDLSEALRLAKERCPAVYSLSKPIAVSASLAR